MNVIYFTFEYLSVLTILAVKMLYRWYDKNVCILETKSSVLKLLLQGLGDGHIKWDQVL